MTAMNEQFKQDYYRMTGKKWSVLSILDLVFRYDLRYLKHLRSHRGGVYTLLSLRYSRKYGLEILSQHIGQGLYLGHAHNINVHPDVIMGSNCNLNKGCTIGRENRGSRNGVPVVGSSVWIGSNAMVCGKIKIGDDVLIAPNSYVNFDVPDHSVVIGNPGRIFSRLDATEGYITNKVE